MVNLNAPLKSISRITPLYLKILEKMGLKTVHDFLFRFPFRYDDFRNIVPLDEKYINSVVTVEGEIKKTKNTRLFRRRMTITEIVIHDKNNILMKAVWFNQPFILDSISEGMLVRLSGKLEKEGKYFKMISPAWEKSSRDATNTGRLVPVYSETSGLTSKWIRWQMKMLLPQVKNIPDIIPHDILSKFHLGDVYSSLNQIHFPDSRELLIRAQKRFAFEEMFLVQLKALEIKKAWEGKNSIVVNFNEKLIKNFVGELPFKLTDAQRKAAFEILKDLGKPRPMNRLLNGDVGSGKTIVAAATALQTISAGYQVALMAPTEVLAHQHFLTFSELFKNQKINAALLTNSYKLLCHCEQSEVPPRRNRIDTLPRNDTLKKISSGKINLIIGTHALIQKDVKFKNLALVIIDEQHRFGVMQRFALQNIAQTNADLTQTNTDNLLYKDLTYKIRGIVFKVKKQLGLGHKESIYQKAIVEELKENGLFFEKEKTIDINYNNKKIGIYRPDFVIEHKIILELKALPSIGKFEKQQIWHYLKGFDYKLALLINFGREDIEIERFIHTSLHESVSSLHMSVSVPHFLTMTATPIPRTLAIAFFGSLDLSILDEMPQNRKPIITQIVEPRRRQQIYEFIRREIKFGHQAFVILPLIEESAHESMADVKAAKKEYERLAKIIFPEFTLGLLHGRLKAKEKEEVMQKFAANSINILVSTSVVEVGIDIPNATMMVVENAERFGLSQLHQFRGRVGRGKNQSYCYLFSETDSERLKIMEETNDGFKIAQRDLELRGPGQFFGTIQSGLPDIAMENLTNIKLIKFAREEAAQILAIDPELKKHPALQDALQKFSEKIHLE